MKRLVRSTLSFSALFCAVVAAAIPQAAVAQTAPAKERSIVIVNSGPTLDPDVASGSNGISVVYNMYDNLYRYEDNPPVMKPWLAKSYTESDDGKLYTFTLNDNVVFHDGKPLTAKDVVYSFQRVLALKTGPAPVFLASLKPDGITAVDDITVRFTLDKPYGPFLAAIPTVAIVNSELLKQKEVNGDWGKVWLASNEAGSGAYQLEKGSFKPGNAYIFRQFNKHFKGWSDNPLAPTVVYSEGIMEQSTQLMGVLNNTVDMTTPYLTPDEGKRVKANGGIERIDQGGMRSALIFMNNTRPPLDNLNFRKCLSYAMDYNTIIKEVMLGTAKRAPTPIPPAVWGNPANPPSYNYNPKLAKEYCDKAKAEGAPITRGLVFQALGGNEVMSVTGQILQSELQKMGIPMTVQKTPPNNLFSMAMTPDNAPDLWMTYFTADYVDPDNYLGQMYDSSFRGGWKSSSFYKNEEVDELLRDARGFTKRADREKLYNKAVELICNDAATIWLFVSPEIRGLSKKAAKGFNYSPISSGIEVRYIQVQN